MGSFVGTLAESVRWMVDSTDRSLRMPGDAGELVEAKRILAASGYRSCLALADALFRVLRDVLGSRHNACVALMMRRPLLEWYIRARYAESVWNRADARTYLQNNTLGVRPGAHQVDVPKLDTAMKGLLARKEKADTKIIRIIQDRDLDTPVHGGVAVFVGGLPEINTRQVYTDRDIAEDIRALGEVSFLAGEQLMRLLGEGVEMLKELHTRQKHFDTEWGQTCHQWERRG